MNNNEYVLTKAVIDPITKSNIQTYIVKDNVKIKFNLVSTQMKPRESLLKIFYYRNIKNKNIKIRCLDTLYSGGTDITLIPDSVYRILKVTNRLNGCLFVYHFDYNMVANDGKIYEKSMQFTFKIVSDREFKMYKDMEEFNAIKAYNDSIVRPKAVE